MSDSPESSDLPDLPDASHAPGAGPDVAGTDAPPQPGPHSSPADEFARRPPPGLGRGLGVGVALLALGGILIALLGGGGSDEPVAAALSAQAPAAGASSAADRPSIGDPDAPITMIEYSDFQCPFCRKFADETQPALLQEYVDKGLLRIEWRDFPAKGDASVLAAVAARAAHEQGRFWEYHDLLYAHQGAAITREALVGYAQDLGLDVAQFSRELDNPFLAEAVRTDYQEGQERGVRGTPTFYFNGNVLVGAQPTDTFRRAVQYLLDEQGTGAA